MSARAEFSPAIQRLIDAGHAAPSADNSQPWRFCWDGKYLAVNYDGSRVAGKTFGPKEHATLLAMGALKENVLQMATFLGLEVEQTHSEEEKNYFQFEIKPQDRDISRAHQHPLFQRHTNRWPYDNKPISDRIIDSINNMSQGECRALVFTERGVIDSISRWVRIASEVRFQTREIHEFLGRSLRFTAEEASRGDGLDVRTLALPPGGKAFLRLIKGWDRLAFLNRFGCYKLLARMEAKPILQATSLVALVGPNDLDNVMNAGMLMERAWIHLNIQGIAAHPYYVITDQLQRLKRGRVPENLNSSIKAMESEIATMLRPKHDTIHILFRIGFPKKNPVRSVRLSTKMPTQFITR
jgi:hypothetical protein